MVRLRYIDRLVYGTSTRDRHGIFLSNCKQLVRVSVLVWHAALDTQKTDTLWSLTHVCAIPLKSNPHPEPMCYQFEFRIRSRVSIWD